MSLVSSLVPSWAKDIKIGSKLINARAETMATKPASTPRLRRTAAASCLDARIVGDTALDALVRVIAKGMGVTKAALVAELAQETV